MLDVLLGQTACLQDGADGVRREALVVLATGKALLLRCGDNGTVDDEACRVS
jgi:hypothetical protein